MNGAPGILGKIKSLALVLVNPNPIGEVFIIDLASTVGEIDYPQLAPYVSGELKPQIHGAIIRGADGTRADPLVSKNYEGFTSLGLPVGVYGVQYPRADAQANKRQAQILTSVVSWLGEYPKLMVWGDWERNPDNIDISATRAAIWKYIFTYGEAYPSKILGAYTNSWWDSNVANERNGSTDIPRDRPLWAASWYTIKPYIAWDWRHRYGEQCHTLHQYDNRFKFPGIPGRVDASTFKGSLAEYYYYFGLGPLPPGGEMRYNVTQAGNGLKIRSTPFIKPDNILGTRATGSVVTPIETTGDSSRYNSYWVRDALGWSAAQWYGVVYMEPFV
jgi:GH25 family lysozyme M1 (1,4-beta-N-acetylmuramidase)